MKPFNLAEALKGDPVWHIGQRSPITDITCLKNKVVYQIAATGDSVFSCNLDGTDVCKQPVLAMKPKTRTIYVNLWDSTSFHYTRYETLEAAKQDHRGLSPQSKSSCLHKKLNAEPIAVTIEE